MIVRAGDTRDAGPIPVSGGRMGGGAQPVHCLRNTINDGWSPGRKHFYQVLQQTRRWHLVHLSSLDILDHFYFLIYLNACPQNVFVACYAVVCKSMILLVSGAELIPAEGPPPPAIVTGPCAASSHHTGPVLTSTIDHYSPIEISEILKSLLDPARARDNDAALCCCVIGREIPHPAAAILQLSWAELVFSFLVLRNVRRLPTKYEVAWKPSINTTISHRYWITLEIFVHSRKNIVTASGEWMEAM